MEHTLTCHSLCFSFHLHCFVTSKSISQPEVCFKMERNFLVYESEIPQGGRRQQPAGEWASKMSSGASSSYRRLKNGHIAREIYLIYVIKLLVGALENRVFINQISSSF